MEVEVRQARVDDCRDRGAHRVFLETELPSAGARRLYERHEYPADDSIWMSTELC